MRRMRLRVQSATCITCDNNFPHSAAAFKVLLFAADGSFFLSAGILCLLPYEHGIAVAEEPVAVFYCGPVGVQNVLASGECAYQHNQCAFRCVEICEHLVNYFEPVARIHKYMGA